MGYMSSSIPSAGECRLTGSLLYQFVNVKGDPAESLRSAPCDDMG